MARYKKAYRPLSGMSLIEFQTKYGTEEACEQALFWHKWPKGYMCPRCGNKTYYKTISRRHSLLECQACGHQESPTNGTAFENYQPHKGHNIPMFLSVVKIPDFAGSTFKAFADEKITSGSVLLSDGFPTCNSLSKNYNVISTSDAPDDETSPLKLVHLFISNAKAMFQGAFHGLGAKRVQGYFSEFTYRFNRRDSKTPVVEHLLRSSVREGYTSVPALCI